MLDSTDRLINHVLFSKSEFPLLVFSRYVRHFPKKTLQCEDTLHVSHLRQEAGPYAPLHDITFCVHKRECLAILGPTGCGRSLLLRVLSGQEVISDGNAYLLGTNLFMHPNQVGLRLCASQAALNKWFEKGSIAI